MRDRLADGAFDVALGEIAAALDLLVEPLEHATRLFAGRARAVDIDVVAALLGDDAEPALDQRQVLPVLTEQDGGEPVVLEGEHDLRGGRLFRGGGGRDRGIRSAQGGSLSSCTFFQSPLEGEGRRRSRRGGIGLTHQFTEQAVAADFGNGHRDHRADEGTWRHDLHRL